MPAIRHGSQRCWIIYSEFRCIKYTTIQLGTVHISNTMTGWGKSVSAAWVLIVTAQQTYCNAHAVPVVQIFDKPKSDTHACSLVLDDFDFCDWSCGAESVMQKRLCDVWVQITNVKGLAAAGIKGTQ